MIIAAGPLLTRSAFLAASYASLFMSSSSSLSPPANIASTSIANSPSLLLSENSEENDIASILSPKVRTRISELLDEDPALAGPLIRLAFHDATTWEQDNDVIPNAPLLTTGGPNGSIQHELDWSENRALSKPLAIVQKVRANEGSLERGTKSGITLSLADTIALAGAAAVEYTNGPHIPIKMGRLDAGKADPYLLRHPLQQSTERSLVTSTMPSAALDSDGLRLYFGTRLQLSEEEWVALSGVHGLGRHVTLLDMSKNCLKNLTRVCLEEAPKTVPFVAKGVDRFSNNYFQYLLLWNRREIQLGDVAFIPTDVALVVDAGLRKHVERFAKDEKRYFRVFARAYQHLVETTAVTTARY